MHESAHVDRVPQWEGLGGRGAGDFGTRLGRIMPTMPGYRDCDRTQRTVGQRYPFGQLGINIKHYMRRRCDAPLDVDFIVVSRVRSNIYFISSQRLIGVQVDNAGCCLMFEFFRVNVVKRRLEESLQKREHTENDATGSHSLN
jgi:hypothetical protein